MQHVDPDRLALLALGEPLGRQADELELSVHLAGCERCRAEVRTLRETAELAREAGARQDIDPVRPPESVWRGIVSELDRGRELSADPTDTTASAGMGDTIRSAGMGDTIRSAGMGDSTRSAGMGDSTRSAGTPGATGITGSTGPAGTAGRTGSARAPEAVGSGMAAGVDGSSVGPRSGRSLLKAGLALVAAATVGVAGTLVVLRPWRDDAPASRPAAASVADLAPLTSGQGQRGRAEILSEPDGSSELRISASGLPLRQGYYEVWVFDPDANRMVSLGALGADSSGAFPVPPTLNLREYNIVDVSAESYDGNQQHSELSVLRGTLTS